MKKLIVLTGAGMSAESGIPTFRDMGGLWQKYDVTEVASPEAWQTNPQLVLDFYNQRRKKLFEVNPNEAHFILARLEKQFEVQIITQNVDDLHERAGSSAILHLHGELKKARSTADESLIYELDSWELKLGDCCSKGSQLRPHIVWFGELVPAISAAIEMVKKADVFLVIGTSLNVYPAANLLNYVPDHCPIYLIDPGKPSYWPNKKITHIKDIASKGIQELLPLLLKATQP